VAAACEARGVILVSDEVYRELYLGPRPASLAEASAYGIVLSSASKAWGGPGLRVGWALGDPEILAPARLVHNYAATAASRPSQEAAAALVSASAEVLPAARAGLESRWAALEEALAAEFGIGAGKPAGGFYLWLPIPDGYANSFEFCLSARDGAGVILSPGSAFGSRGEGFFRLSFAARPADIRLGVSRLRKVWRKP
jgi:aspartate/methionine/tyrosine aminotransferase